MEQVEVNVDMQAADAQTSRTSRVIGQQFRDPSANEVCQVRLDGFSYHKLAPYSFWEDWSARALDELWPRYRSVAAPVRVTRLTVRYVNRIEIPAESELKDFLLTAPDIAPGIPQLISGYAMQVAVPYDETTAMVIREAMVEPPRPDIVAVLLDLAISRDVQLSPDSHDVRVELEELHLLEIEAFERCITNRTREIIS